MSAPNEPTKKPRRFKIKRILTVLIILVLLVMIALRLVITTSFGAHFIENQVNKRSFGQIESVQISGLSGDPLGKFSVQSLVIKDKQGEWARANSVEIDWKLLSVLRGPIHIREIDIEAIDVARKPTLNPKAETAKNINPKGVILSQVNIEKLTLQKPVAGQIAAFSLDGKFILGSNNKIETNAKLIRIDEVGDAFSVDIIRDEAGEIVGRFQIDGTSGGPLANLIKAPADTGVSGKGEIRGNMTTGLGDLRIDFGELNAIDAKFKWVDGMANADALFDLNNWPIFEEISKRVGTTLSLTSTFGIGNENAPFSIHATSPVLDIDLIGLRPENKLFPDSAKLKTKIKQVGILANLPPDYKIGSASADGTIELGPSPKFQGSLVLRDISTPHGQMKSAQGPASITRISPTHYGFSLDMIANSISLAQPVPILFAERTKITAMGHYETDSQELITDSYRIETGSNNVAGTANLSLANNALTISGKGEFDTLALGSLQPGHLIGDFKLAKMTDSALTIDSDGRFTPKTYPSPILSGIVGKDVLYQTRMTPIDGGVLIDSADLIGSGLKTTLNGKITDQLELSGEASLTGPVSINRLSIQELSNISFAIDGPRQKPVMRFDATTPSIRFQNFDFMKTRLRSELVSENGVLKGDIQFESDTKHGALLTTSKLEFVKRRIKADDFNIQLGRLAANGSLALDENALVTGTLDLDLPEKEGQYAKLSVDLSQRDGQQAVRLDADARQIAIGAFELDRFIAKAEGTLDALAGKLETEGHRGSNIDSPAFDLSMPFQISGRNDGAYTIESEYSGQYNNIGFTSSAPSRMNFDKGNLSLDMPLRIADGNVDLNFSRAGQEETLNATIANIPVSLFRMPGNLGDTRGRISGKLDLTSKTGLPEGSGEIALTDWRGFDVQKGFGLNTNLGFTLENYMASWALTSDAESGFKATSNGVLPISRVHRLADMRLDMNAPLQGKFNAFGPAAALIGLITPSDAELAGNLSAEFSLSGTPTSPLLQGSANGSGISFEVPEIGTQIRSANFNASLLNDKLEISNVSASDPNGGKLAASGRFTFGEFARPLGTLEIEASNFKAVDRRDAFAWVSGKLEYTSALKSRNLSGNVLIDKAEIREFVTGSASVIEIDVEEINRPKEKTKKTARKAELPIILAIHVQAPRNVFIRSRGLDVEMSVDANLKGTLTDPKFYGQSSIVRGGYKLAGKNLNFKNGSIKFDGPLSEASVDLKAETETQNITAGVSISGSIENPVIDLSSTPDRPKDEILSALLFGKSVTELSVFETAQLASALAQFSGIGTGLDLLGGVRSSLGLSQLNIDYDPGTGTTVTGGRYLAKNVYLQLFSGSGLDQTGAIIDWEIRENLALRSRVQSDYNQSLSLKWKKDF